MVSHAVRELPMGPTLQLACIFPLLLFFSSSSPALSSTSLSYSSCHSYGQAQGGANLESFTFLNKALSTKRLKKCFRSYRCPPVLTSLAVGVEMDPVQAHHLGTHPSLVKS